MPPLTLLRRGPSRFGSLELPTRRDALSLFFCFDHQDNGPSNTPDSCQVLDLSSTRGHCFHRRLSSRSLCRQFAIDRALLRTPAGMHSLPERDRLERTDGATDPYPAPDPTVTNRAAHEACHLLANGRRGRAPPATAPAASSTASVFLLGTLPLKPAFEHISPETPMRPPSADSKCARYGILRRMAAQGSGRYAECSCGLR